MTKIGMYGWGGIKQTGMTRKLALCLRTVFKKTCGLHDNNNQKDGSVLPLNNGWHFESLLRLRPDAFPRRKEELINGIKQNIKLFSLIHKQLLSCYIVWLYLHQVNIHATVKPPSFKSHWTSYHHWSTHEISFMWPLRTLHTRCSSWICPSAPIYKSNGLSWQGYDVIRELRGASRFF